LFSSRSIKPSPTHAKFSILSKFIAFSNETS
jgi:hypothetical protein